MPAPSPSCAFQPFPNHHTLKQRLSALRVVSTRFVDTDETCCGCAYAYARMRMWISVHTVSNYAVVVVCVERVGSRG